MIIPVRCFSCGKPIGHLFEEYDNRVNVKKESKKEVLDSLNLERFCCRTNMMSHVNSIELIGKY